MTNLQTIQLVSYCYNVFVLFLMGSLWVNKEWIKKAIILFSASAGVYSICVFCKTLIFPMYIVVGTSFLSALLGCVFMFGKTSGDAGLILLFKLIWILSIISGVVFIYFTI